MKQGWTYKKLGEVASSELGKTLNKSKDTGKLYPYICAVNVLWDMIDLTILKHAFFEKEEIDRYSVRKGDLLVCEGGDTGRSAIWEKEEPVLYQNALHRVRFTTEMEARFAMYCLWHLKNNGQIDQKYSKGVTIKHLVKSSLLSIELPVPPLSTQLSIVSELDKINELIRLKKEQLKDYDNLAQSIFYEMFGDPVVNEKGWEVKKLGEVCTYPNKRISLSDITSYEYVGVETLVKNKGGVLFTEELPNAKNAIEYIENDILIGNIRPYLKKIWKSDRHGGASGDVVIIRISDSMKGLLTPVYLFKLLSTDEFFEYDNANTHGAKMPRGDRKAIGEFTIPIPPLSFQQQFAKRIKLIEKQKAEVQRTIADLETLLASRMQYWFD